ncbi:stromal interaction molecule 1, partial [Paragonimus westermani]
VQSFSLFNLPSQFVRQEFSPSERAQKPRTLTSEDPFVSLTDLWAMWRKNPAFNWTIKQTVQWLTEIVDLPQYEDIFVRHSVDGKALPLLAMQNMSYLTDVLIIRNSIDKKKLMLKALDTILFGPPQRQPLMSVKVSVVTASCGILLLVVFALSHWFYHNVAVDDRTKSSPDGPASTERALKQLQARLEDLERLRYTLNSCEVNAELDSASIVSLDTKQCKRLHRKRYNILGSVRLLHTDSLDELECKLVEAKMVLEQLQSELHERMDRWSRVEELTGFTLRTNPGLEKIHSILAASNRITPPMPDVVSSSDRSCITHDSLSLTSSLLCCTDNLSLSQPRTNTVQPLADIPEFQARHMESSGRRHPPIPLPQNRSNLPRNYSFVRPFATVWRRKAGTRLSAISKN